MGNKALEGMDQPDGLQVANNDLTVQVSCCQWASNPFKRQVKPPARDSEPSPLPEATCSSPDSPTNDS